MDPRQRLRMLEEDYFQQPVIGRQTDLVVINAIRTELGLPLVDKNLRLLVVEAITEPQPEPVAVARDYGSAAELYQTFLAQQAERDRHIAYADALIRATADKKGMTPVRPLATGGTDSGPLLCDFCGEPFVLEGGSTHKKTAEEGWRLNGGRDFTSWVLSGLVVRQLENGTLRVYHGYVDRPNVCDTLATVAREQAEAAYRPVVPTEKEQDDLDRYVRDVVLPGKPEEEQQQLLRAIRDLLFRYDPGVGINGPGSGPPRKVPVLRNIKYPLQEEKAGGVG